MGHAQLRTNSKVEVRPRDRVLGQPSAAALSVRVATSESTAMAESRADSESELEARSLSEGHQESTSSCSEQCSTSDTSVPSLLSHLKAPKPSDLARKRRTDTNPPLGKKRGRGSETYDPKTVSALERVKAYPSEPFSVSNKKLFFLDVEKNYR